MDLIERYLAEVRRNLPRRLRDDVCRELRSNIEDSADVRARAESAGRDAVVIDILTEYGPPEEMARFYLPKRCVIGPRFYDSFWSAVRITLLALAGLFAVGFVTEIATTDQNLRETLWLLTKSAGRYPGSAVTLLGIITAVFIVVDRIAVGRPPKTAEITPWDPHTLPRIDDKTRVNRVSIAVDICLYVGLFFFFNFFRRYAGIFNHTNGEWWFLPLSGPGFLDHLLWLNLFWFASLANAVLVLRAGRWTPWTRALRIALAALLTVVLARMALDPDLVGLPDGWPRAFAGIDRIQERFADLVVPVVATLARAGIGIAAVVTGFGVLKKIAGILRGWIQG